MPKLTPIEGFPNLYRRPGYKNIYLQDTFPGIGRKTVCLGTPSIKEALLEAKRIIRELLKSDINYRPVTIKELLLEVIEINTPQWHTGTLEGASNIINNRLIPVFGDLDIKNFREVHWARFSQAFYKDHPNGKLFNTRKYLGKGLRFAKQKGWISQEFHLPIQDKPSRRGVNIPDDHLELIIESARAFKKPDRKNVFRLMVYLGRFMGMRKSEIITLPVTDIDLLARVIRLSMPNTKTKKHKRDMAIAPEVLPLLTAHMKSAIGTYLFPATQGVTGPMRDLHTTWDRACDAAEFDYNFHDTRHTFGTVKVHVEKKPIQDVAAYMGDSVATLERIYLHPNAEHTRHVVEGKLRVVK